MAKPTGKEMMVKREQPHNLCVPPQGGKPHWVESNERHNWFAQIDGVKQKLTNWVCPLHRGEVSELPPSTEEVKRQEIRKADKAADHEIKDEALTKKWGPMRKVTAHLGGGSATTEQVKLECGHQRAATKGVTEVRCAKCKPKAVAPTSTAKAKRKPKKGTKS